jgi:hypothetical protein
MRLLALGLRDYSEPARLLSKFGACEPVARQKAASPVRDVLTITCWGRLTPPETQQVLKRIRRLYKYSCWWPKRGKRRLFDNSQLSSWKAQSWNKDSAYIKFDPADALLLEKKERQDKCRIARMGGEVQHLGHPGKRHASLARSRAAYNEQWDSYTNNNRLSRTLRAQRSLNIPRESIDARNAMIANLERDFAPRNEARAA